MPSLNSVFKLQDKYTAVANKIMKSSDDAANKIMKASGSTDEFNRKLAKTGASAESGASGIKKLIGAVVSLAVAQKGMDIADGMTNTSARLNLINDGLQTNLELQQAIFNAADRSRGSYTAMADAVSKLGLNAADAFNSTGEMVNFTELLQKSFKVGGASTTEQASAMLQLTQAMGAGKLQGDEFRSIMENAPMLADAIAKYMGKSKGELKELSSDGLISADIIKNAIFAAGDDINAKFAEMPVTFGDVWTKIKNHALQSFGPIIDQVTGFLNSDGFSKFITMVCNGIGAIVSFVGWAVSLISSNLDVIIPILLGIATIYLALMLQKLWAMVPALLANASAVLADAGAWLALHWPLLLIVGAIVIVMIALNKLGVSFSDVCGFVGGLIGSFAVGVYNNFVYVWNIIASLANFIYNVFRNPIAAVQVLFLDLAKNVLGYMRTLIQGIEDLINLIPGVEVNLTGGVDKLMGSIESKLGEIKSENEWYEIVEQKDFIDLSEGFSKGKEFGQSIGSKIEDSVKGIFEAGDSGFSFDYGDGVPVKGLDGKNVKVDVADEDLQYLRDIAERDYVAKVAQNTLAPNVQISFGDVHETADAEKLAGRIAQILEEEITTSAEGVYA